MKQVEDNKTLDMFEENEMNTCDRCAHYTPAHESRYDDGNTNHGECALMSDSNFKDNKADRCSGWDVEGYGAGVYVGPKFGCIHWIKKETK